MPIAQSRRRFLTNAALAGAAGLVGAGVAGLGSGDQSLAAEPPPETTKLRLFETPITCIAPEWVAQELLYGEGFTDVEYVTWGKHTRAWVPELLLSGEVDISLSFLPPTIVHIDAGEPAVMLAGSHIGCINLVASNRVGSTRDLKGKAVGIALRGSDEEIFVSMFAAYVGLNPQKDINWVISPDWSDHIRQLAEGKIDAAIMPKLPSELRDKGGHILMNTTIDKPWSQYFCCMIASTRAFVAQHPVATKRALRALLKARQTCAPPSRSGSPGLSPRETCHRSTTGAMRTSSKS